MMDTGKRLGDSRKSAYCKEPRDLIEREAAGRPKTFDELCEDYRYLRMQAIKHQNYADDKVAAIIEAARSLPAAIPVVDVERAAKKLGDIVCEPANGETLRPAWCRKKARAILDAGYIESVRVEDIETACKSDQAETGPPLLAILQARKRLLAAAAGKKGA